MPIYEYDCPKCGRFDALQKMSAPPLRRHDACGSPVRKRAVSAGAFVVKGGGSAAASSRPAPACHGAQGPGCAGCPSAEA
jgi:putative FmdB family regulatory protein